MVIASKRRETITTNKSTEPCNATHTGVFLGPLSYSRASGSPPGDPTAVYCADAGTRFRTCLSESSPTTTNITAVYYADARDSLRTSLSESTPTAINITVVLRSLPFGPVECELSQTTTAK